MNNNVSFYSNLQCSATITTTNSTASVQVTFTDVDILHCCDYLELFDGKDVFVIISYLGK